MHHTEKEILEITGLLEELQEGASLEASVYLARAGGTLLRRGGKNAACRPARRLLRTLWKRGPIDGPSTVLSALNAIETQVAGCGADVSCAAFWWHNVAVVRHEISGAPNLEQLLGRVKEVECRTFWHIFSAIWEGIFVPTVAARPPTELNGLSRASSLSGTASSAPLPGAALPRQSAAGAGGEEVAVQRWLDLLDRANAALAAARCSGTPLTLEHQLMRRLLKRIDRAVYGALAAGGGGGPSDDAALVLGEPYMPFRPSLVSFGVGMRIKMAATRFTQWADEAECIPEGTEPAEVFPCMASSAAVLMLPHERLADADVRAKLCPALSTRDLLSLLKRFIPDDFCTVEPDPGLIQALEAQVEMEPCRSAALDGSVDGSDEGALWDGEVLATGSSAAAELIGSGHMEAEADTESDEELDALAEMLEPQHKPGQEGLSRFQLLKHLWRDS
mmetsp:Transcript_40245/g.95618  ORF Transcript_40245/g.95618 Transcript_40245/m.95618 type:complete len:448 (-) Transcript_40245:190-1533(-)